MSKPINVDDKNFDSVVIAANTPVLVDFWAPWCPPCKMVAPIVEELAIEYAGKVNVAKLNTDENPDTSKKFGIRSIPTLLIFKGGKPVEQIVGYRSKGEIKKMLDSTLAKK